MTNIFGDIESIDSNIGNSVEIPSLADFASHLNTLEITIGEVSKSLQSYAICIKLENDIPKLNIILGLIENMNFYVLPNSSWAVPYIPSVIRAFPFSYDVDQPDDDKRFSIVRSAIRNTEINNDRLIKVTSDPWENEKISAAKDILDRFHNELPITRKVAKTFYDLEIIEPWPLRIQINGEISKLKNIYKINENKLKSLPSETLTKLLQSGFLGIAYAMLLSEERMTVLQSLASHHAKTIEARDFLHKTHSEEKREEIGFDF